MRHTLAFQIVLQFTHCDNIEARGLLFYCVKAVLEAQGAPDGGSACVWSG